MSYFLVDATNYHKSPPLAGPGRPRPNFIITTHLQPAATLLAPSRPPSSRIPVSHQIEVPGQKTRRLLNLASMASFLHVPQSTSSGHAETPIIPVFCPGAGWCGVVQDLGWRLGISAGVKYSGMRWTRDGAYPWNQPILYTDLSSTRQTSGTAHSFSKPAQRRLCWPWHLRERLDRYTHR